MQRDSSEQKSAPFPHSTVNSFHSYLTQHRLLWIEVARAAGVPVLTVWSIDHNLAVEAVQAVRVRNGLYQLTGVPYDGPIPTMAQSGTGRENQME